MRISRPAALVLAAFAGLAPGGCRRETAAPGATSRAQTPAPSGAPAPAAVRPVESEDVATREPRPAGGRAPVIWLGLDGLDFEVLDRLAAEGAMPNWKRLAAEGWTGRLSSDYPLISPILWTTAATGVSPEVHRVLDFQEVDPATGHKIPISGHSRQAPAAWNLASAAGRKVGVVGWWATHPAEEVDGFFVSDRASPMLFSNLSLSGAAWPASIQAGVEQVAARDGKVSAEDLAPYLGLPPAEISAALASGEGMENRVVALSRVLGATRVTQRIARDLYDRTRPDLTAVYFEGTDEVAHVFASFTPPRLACASLSDADYEAYRRVVELYYAAVDRILGQWMRRAEEDGAVLLLHSDHGFKWGSDRPCGLASGDWSTAAFWHRPEGVLALHGPGVRGGGPRGAARLIDVAPTVLALLDVPGDSKMTGRPVEAPFTKPLAFTRSGAAAAPVRRIAAAPMSDAETDEYAKKLLALGYLSPSQARPLAVAAPGGSEPALTEGAWNNLGTWQLKTKKDPTAAEASFREALRLRPDYYSPMFNLAVLYRERGDTRTAEEWLLKSLALVQSDPSIAVVSWARDYARRGRAPAAAALLARAGEQFPGNEGIARERARLLHENKDCKGAIAALARFEEGTTSTQTLNELALYETCLADRPAVERLLARSLALDPNQPVIAEALARVRRPGP